MAKWAFLWFLIIFVSLQYLNALDANVVQNYLHFKFAHKVNIFHCYNKRDVVSFMKTLPKNLTARFFNVNNNLNISRSVVEFKQKLGFLIDGINCPYEEILLQLSTHNAFTHIHPTLIALRNETLIASALNHITLTISTDLQVITEDLQVFDVYNPSTLHGGKLNWTQYLHWDNVKRSFRRTTRENLYWTRRNMSGLLFRSMYVFPQPFLGSLEDYIFDDTQREVNTFNRFHAALMNHVRDYYDYTLNVSLTNTWGFLQPNGHFDGLVGGLELRHVDFGGTPLFFKEDRRIVIDYGRKTWLLRSAFIFQSPKRLKSFEVFLSPLDIQVWYFIIAASVLITFVMRLSLWPQTKHGTEDFEASWSHIALFTIGAVCQQGSATSPNAISARIAFIFIFIFTVLLYQYYSANIVAMLVMSPVKFIHSLQDLAFSTLVTGCEDVVYGRDYFTKLENDTIFAALIKKSPHGDSVSFYTTPEVGIPRVADGGYAFHVELATAYPIISKTFDEDTLCNLDEMEVIQKGEHQGVQKGSPFLEMLNHALHRLDESGLLARQLKHWHAMKPECIGAQSATSPVSIQEFYPALSLLLFGMITSLFMLVFEKIIYLYEKWKK